MTVIIMFALGNPSSISKQVRSSLIDEPKAIASSPLLAALALAFLPTPEAFESNSAENFASLHMVAVQNPSHMEAQWLYQAREDLLRADFFRNPWLVDYMQLVANEYRHPTPAADAGAYQRLIDQQFLAASAAATRANFESTWSRPLPEDSAFDNGLGIGTGSQIRAELGFGINLLPLLSGGKYEFDSKLAEAAKASKKNLSVAELATLSKAFIEACAKNSAIRDAVAKSSGALLTLIPDDKPIDLSLLSATQKSILQAQFEIGQLKSKIDELPTGPEKTRAMQSLKNAVQTFGQSFMSAWGDSVAATEEVRRLQTQAGAQEQITAAYQRIEKFGTYAAAMTQIVSVFDSKLGNELGALTSFLISGVAVAAFSENPVAWANLVSSTVRVGSLIVDKGSAADPTRRVLEALDQLGSQVERMRTEMHSRFDRLERILNARLDVVDARLTGLEVSMGAILGKLDEMQRSLKRMENILLDVDLRGRREAYESWGRDIDARTHEFRTKWPGKVVAGGTDRENGVEALTAAFNFAVVQSVESSWSGRLAEGDAISWAHTSNARFFGEDVKWRGMDFMLGGLTQILDSQNDSAADFGSRPIPNPQMFSIGALAINYANQHWPDNTARLSENGVARLQKTAGDLREFYLWVSQPEQLEAAVSYHAQAWAATRAVIMEIIETFRTKARRIPVPLSSVLALPPRPVIADPPLIALNEAHDLLDRKRDFFSLSQPIGFYIRDQYVPLAIYNVAFPGDNWGKVREILDSASLLAVDAYVEDRYGQAATNSYAEFPADLKLQLDWRLLNFSGVTDILEGFALSEDQRESKVKLDLTTICYFQRPQLFGDNKTRYTNVRRISAPDRNVEHLWHLFAINDIPQLRFERRRKNEESTLVTTLAVSRSRLEEVGRAVIIPRNGSYQEGYTEHFWPNGECYKRLAEDWKTWLGPEVEAVLFAVRVHLEKRLEMLHQMVEQPERARGEPEDLSERRAQRLKRIQQTEDMLNGIGTITIEKNIMPNGEIRVDYCCLFPPSDPTSNETELRVGEQRAAESGRFGGFVTAQNVNDFVGFSLSNDPDRIFRVVATSNPELSVAREQYRRESSPALNDYRQYLVDSSKAALVEVANVAKSPNSDLAQRLADQNASLMILQQTIGLGLGTQLFESPNLASFLFGPNTNQIASGNYVLSVLDETSAAGATSMDCMKKLETEFAERRRLIETELRRPRNWDPTMISSPLVRQALSSIP